MTSPAQELAKAMEEAADDARRAPALAEQRQGINDSLRHATGLGVPRTDTNGQTVRDERGKFAKGLDGGSNGADAPNERGNAQINHLLRARVGVDDGYTEGND